MKKSTVLLLVVTLMAAPAAFGQVFGADAPTVIKAEGLPLFSFDAELEMLGARESASTMRPAGRAMACDWYDIECANGTTDTCCGSSSSCGSYCGEVCGGPCVEV